MLLYYICYIKMSFSDVYCMENDFQKNAACRWPPRWNAPRRLRIVVSFCGFGLKVLGLDWETCFQFKILVLYQASTHTIHSTTSRSRFAGLSACRSNPVACCCYYYDYYYCYCYCSTATTANIPVFALRRDISKQSIYSCFWSSWGKYFSNCLMFCVWSRHFPFLCLWHLLLRLWVWVMTSSRLKYRHLIVEKRYSHRKYQT